MYKAPVRVFVMLLGAIAQTASAGDVVLRVDEFGFRNLPVEANEPEKKQLASFEILVRPGVPFYGRTRNGNATTTVREICRPTEIPDELNLNLRIDTRVATGKFIPAGKGDGKEIIETTRVNTVLRVKLDNELTVGGLQTEREEMLADGTTRKVRSELTMKLSIVERDLETDDEQ